MADFPEIFQRRCRGQQQLLQQRLQWRALRIDQPPPSGLAGGAAMVQRVGLVEPADPIQRPQGALGSGLLRNNLQVADFKRFFFGSSTAKSAMPIFLACWAR